MKSLFFGLAIVVVALFSGCSATIGDLNDYAPTPMREAEFMPTAQEMKNATTKVVLVPMKNGSIKNANEANLAKVLNSSLVSILSNDGSVEVIDREIDAYLSSEVKLHELSSESDIYSDEMRMASYAIKGEISGATFSSRYVKASVWYDKKGKAHHEPAYYVYSSRVDVLLNIYEVPSMRLIKSIDTYGTSRRSRESRLRSGFDQALVQSAGREAMSRATRRVKNIFSPKGYILYKRVDGDDQVYEVSLGSAEGLRHGDDVTIYRKHRFTNPISGESSIREIVIAKGEVSEIVHPHNAWIVVDDVSSGFEIRLGDYIKERYSSW